MVELNIAAPVDLRFEHFDPGPPLIGTGVASPRVSWIVPSASPDYVQSGYELEIARGDAPAQVFGLDSAEQVLVPWPDAPLASRESATVRVRVRSGDQWSTWSSPAHVETGLLDASDWSGRFVSPRSIGPIGSAAPVVSTDVELPGGVPQRARLYASAHGIYELRINGVKVGDDVLSPGWTSYRHRLRYYAYDVTDLLHPGTNSLEALLGNGWFRGRLGWTGQGGLYGDRLALLAQLEVTCEDGSVRTFGTDGSWTTRESGVLADDLYDGQRTDLRVLQGGTSAARSDVEVVGGDEALSVLVAPQGPPVRVTQVVPAVSVTSSPSGAMLVDFGQNLVGWVRLTVRGLDEGSEVVLRHAEVLEHGELGVRPLRSAKATDSYVVAGPDETVLEPSLTFHGFRYAEITGVPALAGEDVQAVVVGSDLRRTGWFESSDPMLNRLHDNVVWGMRGNFVDVPTDCPQRDERLGWTGDIQVFSPTASFLFNAAGFLSSWLQDLAADQSEDGGVPFVIPDVLGPPAGSDGGPAAAAWGDAATLVPWVLHQRTGDVEVLRRQLPSMRGWVDRMAALAGADNLWTGGFQFGDWLDPTAPPDFPFGAKADADVVATAHLARSAQVLSAAARVLGDGASADHYGDLAAAVRTAFAAEYVTGHGRVLSDSATAYAMAICWDLLPGEAVRARAADRLADLVRSSGFRISTGFVGTPLIADALTQTGHVDIAYRLLLQRGCPSWLYAVTMGGTTVWERWDSMLPDGSINPGEMTSFNHYALGAVADWVHRTVGGLAPMAPGYRRIEVAPLPGGGLQSAAVRHLTPYGEAAVAWRRSSGELELEVDIPVGATASVRVPGAADPVEVGHGHHEWRVADPDAGTDWTPSRTATIRDVMDHPRTWDEVVAAVVHYGVAEGEQDLAARLARYLDIPAPLLVGAVSPFGREGIPDGLRARLSQLLEEGSPLVAQG